MATTAPTSGETPKREAILDAALTLFAERGFHGTTVPEIADKAHVGAGTVYRYFASKEELVNVLFREWKTRMGVAVLEDFPLDAPPRRMFHEIFRRLIGFAVEHRQAMEFLELHHHSAYLDAESCRVEMAALEPLRDLCIQMQERGAVRKDSPELLMAVVWGGIVGALRASWLGYLKLNPTAVDTVEDTLWDAMKK